MIIIFLYIKLFYSFRLLTFPPLDHSKNDLNNDFGVFIKNQDLKLKLEMVDEENIIDMYVVVHNRKILFYNKGNYFGFGYDTDGITLKLIPIGIGK